MQQSSALYSITNVQLYVAFRKVFTITKNSENHQKYDQNQILSNQNRCNAFSN